jgi:hypothetical protein
MPANGRWDETGSLKAEYCAYSEQLIINMSINHGILINPYPANVENMVSS